MKNLTKEYMKGKFFEDKDCFIYDYLTATAQTNCIQGYTYTNGKKVLVDVNQGIAYSRNGYFFSVILKDDNYVKNIEDNKKEEIIQYLDNAVAYKYENLDPEVEENEE